MVVCFEILEHPFLPEEVIVECHRILKPTGRLVVSVPNPCCFRNRLALLLGRDTYFIEHPRNRIRIRFFSIKGMKELLANNDFSVYEVLG